MTSTMKFYYTKTLKTLFGDYKNVDTVEEFWNYMEGMAILVVEFQGRRYKIMQDLVEFCLKVNRSKGDFDIFLKGNNAEQTKSEPIFYKISFSANELSKRNNMLIIKLDCSCFKVLLWLKKLKKNAVES